MASEIKQKISEKSSEHIEKMKQKLGELGNAQRVLTEMSVEHIRDVMTEKNAAWRHRIGTAALSLWRKDAASVKALIEYVDAVTAKGSKDFIPPKDRIAVTDMDGTLFCETDPTYFDFCLYTYRVLEDPDYRDLATNREKSLAHGVLDFIETGVLPSGFEVEIGKGIASAFSGLTIKEFEDYIRRFEEQPAPGYDGMERGEAFYKPMLQVLEYLEEHGFAVYICSGSDRQVIREIVSGEVNIAPSRVLGTGEVFVAREQGDTDGTKYVYGEQDNLVLSGQIMTKNLNMNKVSEIAQNIGQQPVLCLGNSTGDISMANYVTNKNPYRTCVFMLCCDDMVRENGNLEKAEKMFALCKENGWVPVSMKNDWTTIYGEGVTKKQV